MILRALKNLFASLAAPLFKYWNSQQLLKLRVREEERKFNLWCYGDTWNGFLLLESDGRDLIKSWNERHGDKLIIKQEDLIGPSMQEMRRIYKEEINGKHS